MATATKSKKVNRLAKAKGIVKKINADLIDASFDAIETTVRTGEKWQKLTAKLIKKAEPITEQQMAMFMETAETLKGQVETGTERLKTLVGYDSTIAKAKKIVSENPIVEKAEEVKNKIQKEVSNNKLVKKAEKMSVKLKKEITETIEDVKEKIEDYTEDVLEDVNEKVSEVLGAKKAPAKKATVKKAVAKKVTILNSTVKNDLKVIKGIGPKLEKTLNKVGFTSFEQLAKMTIKDITKVLSDAGVNTKIYDISGWKAQAKLAFKGDIEAVKNWTKK